MQQRDASTILLKMSQRCRGRQDRACKDPLAGDWGAPGDSLEAACSRILERVSMKFRRRWLVDHCCSRCMGKEIIIDGNAKVLTRLCANTDAGVWNCKPLKCHCLTGCTHPPLPGFRFCALHQGDAESPTYSVNYALSNRNRLCSRVNLLDTHESPTHVYFFLAEACISGPK